MAQKFRYLAFATGTVALLAACAPEPSPVTVEPVYTGKYGAPVGGDCRPAGQTINARYPANLPDCDLQCEPGTMQSAATHVAPLACIPVPHGSNPERPDKPDQQTPTGSITTGPNT